MKYRIKNTTGIGKFNAYFLWHFYAWLIHKLSHIFPSKSENNLLYFIHIDNEQCMQSKFALHFGIGISVKEEYLYSGGNNESTTQQYGNQRRNI